MHPASPNGQRNALPRKRRERTLRRALEPIPVAGELTRWRIDLIAFLDEITKAIRAGASEAHLKRRLEGLTRALEHRLEEARKSA
jgi:hypothetical protein